MMFTKNVNFMHVTVHEIAWDRPDFELPEPNRTLLGPWMGEEHASLCGVWVGPSLLDSPVKYSSDCLTQP